MAVPTIVQEEQSYRRGLVLGFTLAEIVVLVIFLLLLALAALLDRKDQELAELHQELERAEADAATSARALAELERIVDAAGGRDALDDNFKVLVEVRKAMEAEQRALQQRLAELMEIGGRLGAERSEAELEELITDAEIGRTVREAQAATPEIAGMSPVDLVTLAQQADFHVREAANLKGQVQNLRNRISSGGRGTEYPPCWADPETGRIEYIFDVALLAEGFVVRKRELPPHRAAEWQMLPISGLTLDQRIGDETFLAQFALLYALSVQRECRFFVRVFDRTGPTEKAIYKRQMRVLESRFYKYEVLNGSF